MKTRFIISILVVILAIGVGTGLFVVKHEVKVLEKELISLNNDIKNDQKSIHVLNAEWSHLNNPARLRRLSSKYLGLKPIKPSQITGVAAIPFDARKNGNNYIAKAPQYDTDSLDAKMRTLVSVEAE
jgi:cell division protein FtsL